MVDYRAKGEVITPILPPKEEYYLRQNLRLKIQIAQLGLLKGNQSIYGPSLVDAGIWVEQYFDEEDPVTISVLSRLQALSLQQIERQMPDVSASLREIRKLMVKFHESNDRSES